jgi:hypothetical protein
MATVRAVLKIALHALRATAPGDDPTADELATGLEATQSLVLEVHTARGPLCQVDVSGPWIAGEDQRIRIADGDTVQITLPNAVAIFRGREPYDYGFLSHGATTLASQGSTGAADNIAWRAPRDGARVEIVGTTTGLYVYRDDINTWVAATGLTLDAELPINPRLDFAALLAERLADVMTEAAPTPMLLKRIARARAAIFTQPGRAHSRRVGEYL